MSGVATCPVCGHRGEVNDHGAYDYEPEFDDALVLAGNVYLLDDSREIHYVTCRSCGKGFDVEAGVHA